MFCIAVFALFLLILPIGIFFKGYRNLLKKSWHCVFRKVRLKPCDISFGDEVKNKVLGKIAFKFPKVYKFIDKTATFWVFVFIILMIWSTVYTLMAGLNLWVYDTCNPTNGESCALGGEACGVGTTTTPSIIDTVKRIPDRLKNWQPLDYLGKTATYYNPYDSNKKTALEIVDPGCVYCKKLWGNIKSAAFEDKYNMTYIAYPIPLNGGYKFKFSYMIASYIEALKKTPLDNSKVPSDWMLLDKIYTDNVDGNDVQSQINFIWNKDQVVNQLHKYFKEFGYNDVQIQAIDDKINGDDIKNILNDNKNIVENKIKTIKIPTIMFNGKRFDRVVDADTLKSN